MPVLTKAQRDRQRAMTLRSAGLAIGHTIGQPFRDGCVRLKFFPENDGLMSLGELEDLMKHFNFMASCGRTYLPTASDRLVFRLLRDNGVIDAWQEMERVEQRSRFQLFTTD